MFCRASHCRLRRRPGKPDVERFESNAIDCNGLVADPPKAGVPKSTSCFEGMDFEGPK